MSSRATTGMPRHRRAVKAWGLEILSAEPREYSSSLTAVLMPQEHSADALRQTILDRFDMSLAPGSVVSRTRSSGSAISAISTILCSPARWRHRDGARVAGVPHQRGGITAALDYLAGNRAT